MKNPFMLRSTHEAEVERFRGLLAEQLERSSRKDLRHTDEIERLNALLAKTVAPEPVEPSDEQAKLIKSLEDELAQIEQTYKLVEDEKVVVMKGRRRKTRELTALIAQRTEIADKLQKAKAPQVETAAA